MMSETISIIERNDDEYWDTIQSEVVMDDLFD